MRPVRVLHLYSGNLFGGVERLLVTLAQYRHFYPALEAHFALCFQGRLRAELQAAGATPHDLGAVRTRQWWTVWRARRKLREHLRSRAYDVAICHSPWAQAMFAAEVRRATLPLVFWQHGVATGRHWIERWARMTPPDLAISNSRFTAQSLCTVYPNAPVDVLHCPVVLPKSRGCDSDRASVRAELHTPPEATVIIQASRMEAWKGHTLHLQALGMLRHLPNWLCWQVGGAQRPHEARYVEKLKRLAAQHGVADRIRFLGERSDVARLMAAADIHCQPNQAPEPFGIAFIEALSAQLPVLSTAMGGALEIVDDSCGILVPPDDAPALAKSLQHLIESPALRARLGKAGPSRAHHLCDPEQQMARLHTCLSRIMR
jgi:glycosyltransferase involved in cell wall biosynthesis